MKELAWIESGVAHVRKGRVYIYIYGDALYIYNCMINSACGLHNTHAVCMSVFIYVIGS